MKTLLTCATLFLTAAPLAASADELEVHYTLELSSVSSFVFRGDRLSDSAMKPLVQPWGEVALDHLGPGKLMASVWMSAAMGDAAVEPEIDAVLAYAVPAGPLSLKGSYTAYLLPGAETVDAMHELAFQATTTFDLPLSFFAGIAVDPIRAEGWYGFGGATLSLGLGPVAFSSTVNVGGSEYSALAASLQDVTVSAKGTYAFGESGVYVAASAAAAYSGRAEEMFPYAGLAMGIAR